MVTKMYSDGNYICHRYHYYFTRFFTLIYNTVWRLMLPPDLCGRRITFLFYGLLSIYKQITDIGTA